MRSTIASITTKAMMAFRVNDAADRFESAMALGLVSESVECFFMY